MVPLLQWLTWSTGEVSPAPGSSGGSTSTNDRLAS